MMDMMDSRLIDKAADIVDAVREHNPLIDCITNFVTVNDCANILLAFGASPAMCDALDDAYGFAGISNSLYINIGTFIKEHESASVAAMLGAKKAGIPVIVDPVGCGALPRGVDIVNHLHGINGISIIKGNMGEIMHLAGQKVQAKGVDSAGDMDGIEEVSRNLAKKYNCIVVATGKADVITDGKRLVTIHNGTKMLTKITGAGCMLGALCAASAAGAKITGADMFCAAMAGVMTMGIAGQIAAEKTELPGSFRVALMDSIYTITGSIIRRRGNVHV